MNENTKATVCPQCRNHCPVTDLSCGRGRAYFGLEPTHDPQSPDATLEKRILAAMRNCGHYLHHGGHHHEESHHDHDHHEGHHHDHGHHGEDHHGPDAQALFACLTQEEKEELYALLERCLQSWGAK